MTLSFASPDRSRTIPPSLAVRIGVTGTRELDSVVVARLEAQLSALLATVRNEIERAATDSLALAAYAGSEPGKPAAPMLRFLSPLARGADRLAARIALAEGYQLHVPMPFPQVSYKQDFDTKEDLAEFDALLRLAGQNWLALDGDRLTGRRSAYEAAGRYVVRNCDLLIAIWDGDREGNGRGGTAEIVRYAATIGVPVWWLHASQDLAPIWLADLQDFRAALPDAPAPEQALRAYLHGLLVPPPPCGRRHHGLLDRLARAGGIHSDTPLTAYLASRLDPQRSPLWRVHDRFMRLMAWQMPRGQVCRPPARVRPPADPVTAFWAARFRPADDLALRYADRYRSGYIWTFMFATLSVAMGACSLLPPGGVVRSAWIEGFGAAELVMLLLIMLVVGSGIRQDWHERSIEFRLLAELCRKQQTLGPLGWTLPIVELRGLTEEEDRVPERGAWVAWLFAADQRAAPFPTGQPSSTAKEELRRTVLDELIAEQLDYHEARAVRDGRAATRLGMIGEWLFFGVLLLVTAKFCVTAATGVIRQAWPAGLLATILPALSAAFVGIRAYSEVPLLAVQSRHMAACLKCARTRVERLDPSLPLYTQDLGGEAAVVATLMLQDLDGWARLFRVKSLEAG